MNYSTDISETSNRPFQVQMRLMPTSLQVMRAQFLAQAEPCPEWWAYLTKHGLDVHRLRTNHISLGVCLCRCFDYSSGDLGFEFNPSGVPCAVIEALTYAKIEGLMEPVVSDLTAWPLSDPYSFATACGPDDGCELLGALAAVDRAGQPLRLFRTALEWLQADCQGSVPLKSSAGHWLRKCGGPFIVDDTSHATEIRELLGLSGAHHKIVAPFPILRRVA